MLISMTGFGRSEVASQAEDGGNLSVVVEARSINSRFIEISVRLPRTMNERELEVRELVRKNVERGKVSISVNFVRQGTENIPLTINEPVAKAYFNLLDKLRTITGLTGEIQVRDLTSFNEIFQTDGASSDVAKEEWKITQTAIQAALDSLTVMRKQEGKELERDLRMRLTSIQKSVDAVEEFAKSGSADEFKKLKDRVVELTNDVNVINNERLEFEIAMLAERLDITEELVRFRSHIKFFLEAVDEPESAGRKLNFILQEMNREANTIGSKTNLANVAHHVVSVKQELEKIREQVQNIE
ncbi:MAG: YicC/YloC family endoribonuclease [Candidatus Kapaibacterium sp.]|jgi:uncharacterized protein (TIGR00255 family)